MKKVDSKKVVLDHSKAKVNLFQRYLSIYLNILYRTEFINKIYLFDLFAGEGIYEDGNVGSSVISVQTIQDHFHANQKACNDIKFVINEPGESRIEKGVLKIERIQREVENIQLPENVQLCFRSDPYEEIIHDVMTGVLNLSNKERALIFIDPWGYKEVDMEDLRKMTQSDKTEVILFLPIYFMYRFADRSLSNEPFPGSESLEFLLKQIFTDGMPDTSSQNAFIKSMREAFKLKKYAKYVDTFVIERSKGQFFCLFFFTNNPTGMRKMLEAKWNLDEERGYGFRLDNNQGSLFSGIDYTDYPFKLEKLLRKKKKMTNHDIYEYGLDNGYLPTHSNQVIRDLKRRELLEVRSLDAEPARGNYLDNRNRTVEFFFKGKLA